MLTNYFFNVTPFGFNVYLPEPVFLNICSFLGETEGSSHTGVVLGFCSPIPFLRVIQGAFGLTIVAGVVFGATFFCNHLIRLL